jgi:RimJ/RimL family protein N-acetyltransferase
VQLVRYADGDFSLTEALETDPAVMRELGGPTDRSRLPEVHRRRVDDPWWFKIVPDPGGPAAGEIGVWPHEMDGATIHETGWSVLPAFQGRGIATSALRLLIERLRADPAIESIHAFPSVTNSPSNALCRRFEFALLGEREFVYRDHTLRGNHWMLVLSTAS